MSENRDKEIDEAFDHLKATEVFRDGLTRISDKKLKAEVEINLRWRLGQWHDEISVAEHEKGSDDFFRKAHDTMAGARLWTDAQEIMWKAVKENERINGEPELGSLVRNRAAQKKRQRGERER